MTKRIEVTEAPAPLEEYVKHFDALFSKSNQRDGFRRYVEGLLLPSERHKMLTGLANTEPMVGAQLPRAQALQWFLSEADWDEPKMQESRLQRLREDPTTTPTSRGVLVIDETGDRKAGNKTAHVGRQYLGKLGKVDNGVVSVTSLWVEQSYKQVKHTLGWSQYQVRSDRAIRRHWQLVCCAFSFCWYHASHPCSSLRAEGLALPEPEALPHANVTAQTVGAGKKISEETRKRAHVSWPMALRAVRGWLEPWIMWRRSRT